MVTRRRRKTKKIKTVRRWKRIVVKRSRASPEIRDNVSRERTPNKARIKVVGVGGGGGNAISRMKEEFIRGVEFIAINTDAQDLEYCNAHHKICIGRTVTRGLGTGMNPELGRQAAEESRVEISEVLKGADLIFLTAGLGGGTGSGASLIIAEAAKEAGALVIAVVTKPFSFEGGQRMRIAEEALAKLKERVDAYISVPNDRIFEVVGKETSINKAFEAIDGVLRGGVQGIAELIAMPGIINVDFADVRTIMQASGPALVGIGLAAGKERGINAVRQVLNFPLLETPITGAKGVLFGISGGRDMKMAEINQIAREITENIDPAAKVIFGAYYDRRLKDGRLKVTLIATGFGIEGFSRSETTELRMSTLFGDTAPVISSGMVEKIGSKAEPRVSLNLPVEKSAANPKKLAADSKIAASEPSPNKAPKKKPIEIWDIPAFLRKRKN